MNICEQRKCTGCMACANACPQGAIKVKNDNMDRYITYIEEEKCIKCGLCRKVCEIENKASLHEIEECYAMWTKNKIDIVEASSGGVATGLGMQVIQRGGVVCGTRFSGDSSLNLMMDLAYTEEELMEFRGSKYVQAYTGDIYSRVKIELDLKKEVLFIGTPCQVDGLLHFLRKPYNNLITVDIICHGVTPIEYLRQHLETVCVGKNITKATFRGKYDYDMCFYEKNKKDPIYRKKNQEDTYYFPFLQGVTFRENCYECQYAGNKRISDISIGDFWGLDRSSLHVKTNQRISAVLVNSNKGKKFLEENRREFEWEQRETKEALKCNQQLNHPVRKSQDRLIFEKEYIKENHYENAIKKTGKYREICEFRKKQNTVVRILKRILKK